LEARQAGAKEIKNKAKFKLYENKILEPTEQGRGKRLRVESTMLLSRKYRSTAEMASAISVKHHSEYT
jgi:hypothetical protein